MILIIKFVVLIGIIMVFDWVSCGEYEDWGGLVIVVYLEGVLDLVWEFIKCVVLDEVE